jgi:hypothetical protein
MDGDGVFYANHFRYGFLKGEVFRPHAQKGRFKHSRDGTPFCIGDVW